MEILNLRHTEIFHASGSNFMRVRIVPCLQFNIQSYSSIKNWSYYPSESNIFKRFLSWQFQTFSETMTMIEKYFIRQIILTGLPGCEQLYLIWVPFLPNGRLRAVSLLLGNPWRRTHVTLARSRPLTCFGFYFAFSSKRETARSLNKWNYQQIQICPFLFVCE